MKTSTITLEDRYKAALTDLRLHSDILVFDNYPTCCGSCAGYEIEQEHPDANYVFFIDQQGHGLTWKDGKPFNYEKFSSDEDDEDEITDVTPARKVYFNHSNLHAAKILRDTLAKFGLPVEWDGTDMRCVVLNFED